ncbi:MAG: DUF4221 domain-containing protein [Bacteroidetes bacterium]|nr:MAG: DUF4221 domain-containing protein [Bacteroidota bacterium]
MDAVFISLAFCHSPMFHWLSTFFNRLIIWLVLLLVVAGCSSEASKEDVSAFPLRFEPADTLRLTLSQTAPNIWEALVNTCAGESGASLLLVDPYLPGLQVYDPATGQPVQTIPLETEGPNDVGQIAHNLQAACLEAGLFGVYKSFTPIALFVVNDRGEVIRKIDLTEKAHQAHIVPFASETSRPVVVGGKLLVGGYPYAPEQVGLIFSRIPSVCSMDWKSGTVDFVIPFPSVYDQGFYGVTMPWKYTPSLFFDQSRGHIWVSWPVSDTVLCFNPSLELLTRVPMSTGLFKPDIPFLESPPPLDQPYSRAMVEQEDLHSLTHSEWQQIFVMEQEGVPYVVRMAMMRPGQDEYMGGKKGLKAIVLVAFDAKTGEEKARLLLDTSKWALPVFFLDGRIYAGRADWSDEDEDHMYFEGFELVRRVSMGG